MRTPKGILILASITMIGAVYSLKPIHMLIMGMRIEDDPFRIYYAIIGIVAMVSAVGLILMKRWAFITFISLNMIISFTFLLNILFVEKYHLLRTGYPAPENLLANYRSVMTTNISISLIVIGWTLMYRKYYRKRSNVSK